eukprot:5252026-Alexandrium_andersonii.AAC.1
MSSHKATAEQAKPSEPSEPAPIGSSRRAKRKRSGRSPTPRAVQEVEPWSRSACWRAQPGLRSS